MTAPEGGFYSALDAETEGEEGAYYVWTRDEVKAVLGEGADADAFAQVYGLTGEPNVEDGRLRPARAAHAGRASRGAQDDAGTSWKLACVRSATRLLAVREKRPAPLARRQDPDRLERPDDRRVRRRLPRAQGREVPPGGREGRELPAREAADPGRTAAADLSRRAAPRFPPTSRTTRSWPTDCCGLHQATGDARWLRRSPVAGRPDDRRFRGQARRGASSSPPPTTRACWHAPRTRSTTPCPAATAWRFST